MPNRKPCPPPPVPPKSTGPGVGINFDLILDSSLIPSLPPPGGRVGNHELMGRGYGSVPTPPPFPSGADRGGVWEGMLSAPHLRPNSLRRSFSVEDSSVRSNRAGVGAAGMTSASSASATRPAGSSGHARNLSAGSVETAPGRRIPSRGMNGTVGRVIAEERERKKPGMLRRTSSLESVPVRPDRRQVSQKSHSRTSSDTLVQAPALGHTHTSAKAHSGSLRTGSSTNDGSGIETGLLHLSTGDRKITKTLTTLLALIPTERVPHPPPPKPNTNMLDPYCLLTPLAIVLEALVCEREVLKGTGVGSPGSKRVLPLLRDGSSFQLPSQAPTSNEQGAEGSASGSGELDWKVTKAYIFAMGSILDTLLPYLRELPSSSSARGDAKVLQDLLKSLRTYVGKMKKVFGQVATMYVDEYSFVRGWWDESGMKGAAGEVGRWGDLFDA